MGEASMPQPIKILHDWSELVEAVETSKRLDGLKQG
jgi:hypothetical protein